MDRTEFAKYISEKYSVAAERPFERYPNVEVFRHGGNKKWFAAIMNVHASKFGIYENRNVNIVNLKCTPEVLDEVWQDEGIFPAYHMNKDHWISVFLDGSVDEGTLKMLLEASYNATAPRIKK